VERLRKATRELCGVLGIELQEEMLEPNRSNSAFSGDNTEIHKSPLPRWSNVLTPVEKT